MRPARVGEEPDPLMAHYALYAVKQNSGVKITLVDQGAHDKLHVVSIDLDKPDEVAAESFRLLIAQIRAVEKQERDKLS